MRSRAFDLELPFWYVRWYSLYMLSDCPLLDTQLLVSFQQFWDHQNDSRDIEQYPSLSKYSSLECDTRMAGHTWWSNWSVSPWCLDLSLCRLFYYFRAFRWAFWRCLQHLQRFSLGTPTQPACKC